jgi:hypothetical protein
MTKSNQDARKLLKLAEDQLLSVQEMLMSEIGNHAERYPSSLMSSDLIRTYAKELQKLAGNIDLLHRYTQEEIG